VYLIHRCQHERCAVLRETHAYATADSHPRVKRARELNAIVCAGGWAAQWKQQHRHASDHLRRRVHAQNVRISTSACERARMLPRSPTGVIGIPWTSLRCIINSTTVNLLWRILRGQLPRGSDAYACVISVLFFSWSEETPVGLYGMRSRLAWVVCTEETFPCRCNSLTVRVLSAPTIKPSKSRVEHTDGIVRTSSTSVAVNGYGYLRTNPGKVHVNICSASNLSAPVDVRHGFHVLS
jgi:hypothetical protein